MATVRLLAGHPYAPGWSTTSAALCLALAAAMFPGPVQAQEDQEDPWAVSPEDMAAARSQPLFQSADVLEFTLNADFHAIRRDDRKADSEEREATLTITDSDGSESVIPLKMVTRGNWRLNPRNCQFPPLWLDFDKDGPEIVGTPFEGQNRLKLYVPCRINNDRFEQYILNEYLIYPTYNLLTDASFQARPVRVTYVDDSGEDDTFSGHAFLLEHKDKLAARNEAVPIDLEQLHPAGVEQESAALVEVFQYMMGMVDWSAVFFHNIELMRRTDGKMIPVAYDFDWSGMVNTRYSEPDPSLPIRSTRQRHFMGFCREMDYAPVWSKFAESKGDIYALWQSFPLLEDDTRKKALEYLDDFYETLEDDGKRGRIMRGCQKMPG